MTTSTRSTRNDRAQVAWCLLLAVPDLDAPGTSSDVAQAAKVTTRTIRTMKPRLRHLRARGQAITGTWANDMHDSPRPCREPRLLCAPRPPHPSRLEPAPLLRPEEKAARRASRMAEKLELQTNKVIANRARAAAQRAEVVAQQEATLIAWREWREEVRVQYEATFSEKQPRRLFIVPKPKP
jgi:transcription initiation factor TFIIIB Brf1 subunit/transcription initiation factor TFIIB